MQLGKFVLGDEAIQVQYDEAKNYRVAGVQPTNIARELNNCGHLKLIDSTGGVHTVEIESYTFDSTFSSGTGRFTLAR